MENRSQQVAQAKKILPSTIAKAVNLKQATVTVLVNWTGSLANKPPIRKVNLDY